MMTLLPQHGGPWDVYKGSSFAGGECRILSALFIFTLERCLIDFVVPCNLSLGSMKSANHILALEIFLHC